MSTAFTVTSVVKRPKKKETKKQLDDRIMQWANSEEGRRAIDIMVIELAIELYNADPLGLRGQY